MQECARHLNKLCFLSKNGRMSWIEKRSFPVMVIFGHFHFQFSSSQATIHGHNEFSAKACPCFDVKKELT